MKTIHEARQALSDKKITPAELIENTLAQIESWNPIVHAFLEVLDDDARKQVSSSEDTKKPLAGIPIAIKDNICTIEGHTTAASKILKNFTSPYEATVIKKLKEAGAIIIGKANLDEFAMGSSTEFSAYGVTRNPWDTSRVAGGSSGGSIVAVATGSALGALGTDTGGSIRQPASFCSVVGVKPTYGRVSRFGAIAYGSSLDQIGPVAKTVKDSALLLEIIAGHDPLDATSSTEPVPKYTQACGKDITGLKVGVPREFMEDTVDAEVKEIVTKAIEELKKQGAVIKEISLPLTPAAVAVYFLIAKAEASTNLARFDAVRYGKVDAKEVELIERYLEVRGSGFGPEVKRAILMGTYALSAGYYDAWYKQAGKVRTLIKKEYEDAFKEVDVIVGPVSPEPAFMIGKKADDPLAMYLADALTVPQPIAGLPALSVPCGFTKEGLPVGLQVIASHFEESVMFQVAHAYEQANDWWKQEPKISVKS